MTRRGIFIEEFMLEPGLKLKGCALLLYALIYSYTINNMEMYEKEESLAKRLCYSREVVGKTLNKLVQNGLIIRKSGLHMPGYTHVYVAVLNLAGCDKMSHPHVIKHHIGMREKVTSACEKKSHDNKTDIKEDNIINGHEKQYSLFTGAKIPAPKK